MTVESPGAEFPTNFGSRSLSRGTPGLKDLTETEKTISRLGIGSNPDSQSQLAMAGRGLVSFFSV